MRVAMLLRAAPLALLLSFPAFAATAPLTPGNIVVAVSGKGASGISFSDNQASPLSLYQYAPTGTNSAVRVSQSVVNGSVNPISSEYGSSSEGLLQRSADGKSLTIMGYAINASDFDGTDATTGKANALKYVPQTTGNAGKLNALAQSTSMSGGTTAQNADGTTSHYDPIARVIATITSDGTVDTSTALFNVFDQNNPRSVYKNADGTYYISGQGVSGDTTGGVYYVKNGVTTAITGLDTSKNSAAQDTRDVQVVNGQLYVSADSKQGSNNNRDFVGTLGSGTPTSTVVDSKNKPTGPTGLPGFGNSGGTGKMTLTADLANNLDFSVYDPNSPNFDSSVAYYDASKVSLGKLEVNLSPEQYFFADANTLYVADSGQPKNDSVSNDTGSATFLASPLGDGGLQKWVKQNGVWTLAYTLSDGLNLVANNKTSGTTGLFGLAGQVSADGKSVSFYATNYTIGDTDTSYLYAITDTLLAGSGAGESFSVIDSSTDSKFMGVAFAPDATAQAAVPEPAGWTVMVVGFGLLGGALRRRRPIAAL